MISRPEKGRALRLWAGPEGVPGLLEEGGARGGLGSVGGASVES